MQHAPKSLHLPMINFCVISCRVDHRVPWSAFCSSANMISLHKPYRATIFESMRGTFFTEDPPAAEPDRPKKMEDSMRTKCVRNVLLSGAALLLAGITYAANPSQPAYYTGMNAINDAFEGGGGITHMRAMSSALSRALATLKPTDQAFEVYTFTDETIKAADFECFLQAPMAMTSADQGKVFTFLGSQRGAHYVIDYVKRPVGETDLSRLLDATVQLKVKRDLKPLPDERQGYGIFASGAVVLGEMNHRNVSRLAVQGMKIMTPANVRVMTPPASASFSSVKGLARKLIDEVTDVLPGSSLLVDKYSDLVSHTEIKKQGEREYLDFSMKMVLNLAALTKDYPYLGSYLDRLLSGFKFVIKMNVLDKEGQVLTSSRISGKEKSIEVNFKTAGGAILPTGADGRVRFDKALWLDQIKRQEAKVAAEFFGNVYGLKIFGKKIEAELAYKDGPVAQMKARMARLPEFKFQGAAFGIFTPGIVDFFIPGSIEEYASKFSKVLYSANKGRGTYAIVKVDTTDPRKALWRGELESEILDNYFLRFGLSIASDYIWPDMEVLGDLRKLAANFSSAVDRDMVRLLAREQRGGQLPASH